MDAKTVSGRMRFLESGADFRAKAAGGVVVAALTLLLPYMILSVVQRSYLAGAGSAVIVLILARNARLVAEGRDYERLTFYGLVPFGMLFMVHVFRLDGIFASVWCYPAVLACYCVLGLRRALIANVALLAIALPMMAETLEPALSTRFSGALLTVSAFAYILVCEIDAMRRRLHFQIEHDPLTGLLNRTSLKRGLEDAIDARRERGLSSTLLAIDIDHFKLINDRFGHDVGDRVLCEIGRLLRESVRRDDAVFRLGGEEFLILLHGIDTEMARARAEALRGAIERSTILQSHPVTASVGLATLDELDGGEPEEGDERDAWSRRADERLYAAKRAGRNRVVWRDEPGRMPSRRRAQATVA